MSTKPLIKICGMRDAANITEAASLHPDMMGFIFYPGSRRYVGDNNIIPEGFPQQIEKVGVFVNSPIDEVLSTLKRTGLNTAQLHGNETPDDCRFIKEQGFKVMKAFGIHDTFNWKIPEPYVAVTDCFVFDTKTKLHGGSGQKFNWKLLETYPYHHPFLLSGGIQPDDAETLKRFEHPYCIGFDLNSGFETEPALKDVNLLKKFIDKLK
jgi:phosphoribosylanthranilate isomerase